MNKIEATKLIVNTLTDFGLATTTRNIVRRKVPASDNAVINLLVDASVIVTAWATSSAVLEGVHANTDRQIDDFYEAIKDMKDFKEKKH